LAALALLVCVAAFGLGRESSVSIAIKETDRVTRGDLERVLTATGIIKPEEGAEVKTGSRFTGVIKSLYVKLGDKVIKGQPVAALDSREQQAECLKLEATLTRLETELKLLNETYPLRIQEAEANLESTQADKEYAETIYKRYLPLATRQSAAATDLDKARQQLAVTNQDLIMRRAYRDQLLAEYRLGKPRLELSIKEAAADLESARIRLSYATITSPIDGVVSGITAQEGETVVAGLQVVDLITVLDVSRLELRVYVDENDIGEVSVGDLVRFRVEAYPDRQFVGTVDLIHPGPELRNNIVYYRALVRLVPETALALRSEMTVRCELVVDSKKDVLLIPNSAFKWIGQRRLVLRIDDSGLPEPVDVASGMTGMTHTEVLHGLKENTEVVTRLAAPETLPPEWEQF
jgi:multidrug efflux pump subunit AcrA (membrane-fusion protein)